MKKIITVLIKTSELIRNFKETYSCEDIQSFTRHLLQPYRQLKYFAFCDFTDVNEAIIGKYDKETFLTEFKSIVQKQNLLINDKCKTNSINIIDIEGHAELIKILSGRFNNNTFFYNSINDSTYIDKNTNDTITSNPELYILSKVNINR